MANNAVEPSANLRAIAHELRELHVALIGAGFVEQQALHLTGEALSTMTWIAAEQQGRG